MESRFGEVRKVHVVYFLSRDGNVEHPHLIKVHPVVRNGVRLKDVKRWLSNLRGKDMPNSFSWSYKRRYKNGYVWQDLCDNDLITPICDNEYILKGSEITGVHTDRCTRGDKTPTQLKSLEGLQNKNQLQQISKGMLDNSPKPLQNNEDLQNYSEVESCKEIQNLKECNNIIISDYTEENDGVIPVEYTTKRSGNTPSKSLNNSGEVIKVYKAFRSNSTGPRLDASTQTGESKRLNSDKQESPPLLDLAEALNSRESTVNRKSPDKKNLPQVAASEEQRFSSATKFSCMRNDVILSANSANKSSSSSKVVSRQAKAKTMVASHVLRQLFSCGGIETRDSGIRSVKALSFNSASTETESRSNDSTVKSQSSTPKKNAESNDSAVKSQPTLTNSVCFSELLSVEKMPAVTKCEQSDSKSNLVDGGLLDSKRQSSDVLDDATLSQKSSRVSSGECYSEKNIVDIHSTESNSYYQVELNANPETSPTDGGDQVHKYLIKASPSSRIEKGSRSPSVHLEDLSYQTALLSPKNDSKSSRKIKTPEGISSNTNTPTSNVKQNVESNCLQCGRAFRADYLKAHSKYCRGLRNGKKETKATNKVILAK
eukprot:Gb_01816 [translate_table: standard]